MKSLIASIPHRSSKAGIMVLLLLGMLLAGCGPKVCNCISEAEKENPDQQVLNKCREMFASMDEAEVQKAVEKCGK
jgi:hypothetical protein